MDKRVERHSRTALAGVAALVVVVALGAIGGMLLQRSPSAVSAAEAATATVLSSRGGGQTEVASAMVLTPAGQAVTTDAVVEGALSLRVQVPGHAEVFAASVAGLDPTDDLALLQLQNASGLATVALGTPPDPSVGTHVIALAASASGAPQEVDGVVSGLHREVAAASPDASTVVELTGSIEIDSALPGAAPGGPLLDSAGEVIGMDALTADQVQPRPAGGGFATPVALVESAVHAMVTGSSNPHVLRGSFAVLGVDMRDNTASPGAFVLAVSPASPAQAVGIVPGDVLVDIGGTPITGAQSVPDALRRHHPFDQVVVRWVTHSGETRATNVVLSSGTAT